MSSATTFDITEDTMNIILRPEYRREDYHFRRTSSGGEIVKTPIQEPLWYSIAGALCLVALGYVAYMVL